MPVKTSRSGWVTFAAVVAFLTGGYNLLTGLAAITDDKTLASTAKDVLFGINLSVWGWSTLITGAVQILAGVLIIQRNEWGLALGVTLAGLSALITVFVIFVFPLWAIAVLSLDALVMYALLTRAEEFS
jgi:hypothetical protein